MPGPQKPSGRCRGRSARSPKSDWATSMAIGPDRGVRSAVCGLTPNLSNRPDRVDHWHWTPAWGCGCRILSRLPQQAGPRPSTSRGGTCQYTVKLLTVQIPGARRRPPASRRVGWGAAIVQSRVFGPAQQPPGPAATGPKLAAYAGLVDCLRSVFAGTSPGLLGQTRVLALYFRLHDCRRLCSHFFYR